MITAQLIAFKITHYSLILVAIGFFTLFTSKHERARHYGSISLDALAIFPESDYTIALVISAGRGPRGLPVPFVKRLLRRPSVRPRRRAPRSRRT